MAIQITFVFNDVTEAAEFLLDNVKGGGPKPVQAPGEIVRLSPRGRKNPAPARPLGKARKIRGESVRRTISNDILKLFEKHVDKHRGITSPEVRAYLGSLGRGKTKGRKDGKWFYPNYILDQLQKLGYIRGEWELVVLHGRRCYTKRWWPTAKKIELDVMP